MCDKLLLPTFASNTFGIDSPSVESGGYTWNWTLSIRFQDRILNHSQKKEKYVK